MDILKLNKIVLLFFILISCNNKDNNCETFVASGEGFMISFKNYSPKDNKKIKIFCNNKKIKWQQEKEIIHPYSQNYNIVVFGKIFLEDTLRIDIDNKKLKIYDFANIIEEGFDESHRKIKFCRYFKSKINNQETRDEGNNIILIDLKKY